MSNTTIEAPVSRRRDVRIGGDGAPALRARWIWTKRFALVLTGLLVAAVLSELLVLLILGEQVKFPRHVVGASWGLRYNEPGAHYRHKSPDGTWYFKINNQGMRSERDYAYAKPKGTFRIISLGDSFTVGYEVKEEECFSRVLERELNTKGFKVEVLNCGVSGFSNAEALLYLERELLKYEPDVVVLSFFFNDLVDNVRTGLFTLKDGKLVAASERYVPGGALGDFLNTNWLFSMLSGYSNAFAVVKEKVTFIMKRSVVERNRENLDAADMDLQELAAAILDRLYVTLKNKKIPFVIQSIPTAGLIDRFPLEYLDVNRPGIYYLPTKALLAPRMRNTQMYNTRSHGHWTAAAHEISGRALAELILEKRLLPDH